MYERDDANKVLFNDLKEDEVYEKAANTIGLSPITEADIDRLVQTQDINPNDGPMAGLLATVTEYLELQLKLSIDGIGGLENFHRIFKSKSKSDLVYIEFNDSAPVKELYKQAAKIPNSSHRNFRLQQYIPQELFTKFKVASQRCKAMRDENENLQNKIMIDRTGFRVKYKHRGGTYYKEMTKEMIGEFSEIELLDGISRKAQLSPQKGRQRDSYKCKDISP